MYKDELEEATTQITSLKKKLAEHQEVQHLRSFVLDRNTLTSLPNFQEEQSGTGERFRIRSEAKLLWNQ
jgi:hypothetical protein